MNVPMRFGPESCRRTPFVKTCVSAPGACAGSRTDCRAFSMSGNSADNCSEGRAAANELARSFVSANAVLLFLFEIGCIDQVLLSAR